MPETQRTLPTSTSEPCRRRTWLRRLTHPLLSTHPSSAATAPDDAISENAGKLTEQIRTAVLTDYHHSLAQRSRDHTIALVRDGVHIGPTPYGYRRHIHPAAGCARGGAGRRATLTPDPNANMVVSAIFQWAADGMSLAQLAARLSAAPCSPISSAHRTGHRRRWSTGVVRAILTNPVYTGRTVWGRTHRRLPVPPEQWVLSAPGAHPALVDDSTFAQVQHRLNRHVGPWLDHAAGPQGADVG